MFFKNIITVVLFLFLIFCSGFSQEIQILNEEGIPVYQNPDAEFVPDEIIVNFKPQSIILPNSQFSASISEINTTPQLESLLNTTGASEV